MVGLQCTHGMWHCHTQADDRGRGVVSAEKRREYVGGRYKHAATQADVRATGQNFLPSVASQVVGKMQKISTFIGDPTQKGEVLLDQ